MTEVQNVNLVTSQNQTIGKEEHKKYALIPSFKAQNDSFSRQLSPQQQQQKMLEEYQKEQKKQKTKQNISLAVSIGAGIAIIASVVMSIISAKKMNSGEMKELGGISKETFKSWFYDVSKEKSFDKLFLEENSAMKLGEIRDKMGNAQEYAESHLPVSCKTMILYGPQGTGKTSYAYALAKELNAEFISVAMSDIISPYTGMSEKNLKAFTRYVIEYATELKAKHPDKKIIIFFDEVDRAIMRDFSANMAHTDSVINEFKECFNKLYELDNVSIIGATNKEINAQKGLAQGMGMLDEAMVSRFGDPIYVGYPNAEAMSHAIAEHFKGAKHINAELLDPENQKLRSFLEILTQKEHKFSFRNLHLVLLQKVQKGKGKEVNVNSLIDAAIAAEKSLSLTDKEIQELQQLKLT